MSVDRANRVLQQMQLQPLTTAANAAAAAAEHGKKGTGAQTLTALVLFAVCRFAAVLFPSLSLSLPCVADDRSQGTRLYPCDVFLPRFPISFPPLDVCSMLHCIIPPVGFI